MWMCMRANHPDEGQIVVGGVVERRTCRFEVPAIAKRNQCSESRWCCHDGGRQGQTKPTGHPVQEVAETDQDP